MTGLYTASLANSMRLGLRPTLNIRKPSLIFQNMPRVHSANLRQRKPAQFGSRTEDTTHVCQHSCCGTASATHSHHEHDHKKEGGSCSHGHHHHGHCHGHHHHHSDNAVSRALEKIGLSQVADKLAHSSWCIVASMACFAIALIVNLTSVGQLLPQAAASAIYTASISGTFLLSGIPQLVESLCIAGDGTLDTHVLMSLAVFGTLYMGMAQEVSIMHSCTIMHGTCILQPASPRRGKTTTLAQLGIMVIW